MPVARGCPAPGHPSAPGVQLMRSTLALTLLAIAPACGGGGGGDGGGTPVPVVGPFFPAGAGTEPTAGTWRTWVIDPAALAFAVAPAPLPDSAQTQAELA